MYLFYVIFLFYPATVNVSYKTDDLKKNKTQKKKAQDTCWVSAFHTKNFVCFIKCTLPMLPVSLKGKHATVHWTMTKHWL